VGKIVSVAVSVACSWPLFLQPEIFSLILKFSLCSAIGQVFIFFTLTRFDPLAQRRPQSENERHSNLTDNIVFSTQSF